MAGFFWETYPAVCVMIRREGYSPSFRLIPLHW